ncbi:hypothetical protein PG994_013651 [Apiospora phragmitis]|uniref:2EXR domain-containing protein n=1 Tax=Apiospora phragmitis TaxID=2905665 RepID=A0ABR1T990_9PEZI
MAADKATPGFALFASLPPELRLLIWKEALAVDCVWVAIMTEPKTEHLDGTREARFRMRFMGPSPPHLVGQACHEARQTMKAVFGRPFRGPRGPKLIMGHDEEDMLPSSDNDQQKEGRDRYYWVNPATTVLVLPGPRDARRLLDGIAAEELGRVRHLSVFWAHWATVAALTARLRRDCPGLYTLIIEKGRLRYQKYPEHLRVPGARRGDRVPVCAAHLALG